MHHMKEYNISHETSTVTRDNGEDNWLSNGPDFGSFGDCRLTEIDQGKKELALMVLTARHRTLANRHREVVRLCCPYSKM